MSKIKINPYLFKPGTETKQYLNSNYYYTTGVDDVLTRLGAKWVIGKILDTIKEQRDLARLDILNITVFSDSFLQTVIVYYNSERRILFYKHAKPSLPTPIEYIVFSFANDVLSLSWELEQN